MERTTDMIEISNTKDPCFAMARRVCMVVKEEFQEECGVNCPFYKPAGCEDWVRIERNGIWLIPPEEYYLKRKEHIK